MQAVPGKNRRLTYIFIFMSLALDVMKQRKADMAYRSRTHSSKVRLTRLELTLYRNHWSLPPPRSQPIHLAEPEIRRGALALSRS